MLWARSADLESRTLPERVREEARSDGQFDAVAAVAAGRTLARVSGPALEATGARSEAGGTRETQYVPTLTLDKLLETFPVPNLIKIDVEGAEEMVLRGANTVLSKYRPILYCEVGETQRKPVTALLESHGYQFFALNKGQLLPQPACCFNTVAIHRDALEIHRHPS